MAGHPAQLSLLFVGLLPPPFLYRNLAPVQAPRDARVVNLSRSSFNSPRPAPADPAVAKSSGDSSPVGTSSREGRAQTMVPLQTRGSAVSAGVGDDGTRCRGLSDLDSALGGLAEDEKEGEGSSAGLAPTGTATRASFVSTDAPTPYVQSRASVSLGDRERFASTASGFAGRSVDEGDDLPWSDDDRLRLESVLGVSVSRSYVFVAGDLNYRLRLTEPEQALRAIHTAANDPVCCSWSAWCSWGGAAASRLRAPWHCEIRFSPFFPAPSCILLLLLRCCCAPRWHFQRVDTAWLRVVVYDQLLKEMKRSAVLPGFEEAPILFPPTYRYVLKGALAAVLAVGSVRGCGAWFDVDPLAVSAPVVRCCHTVRVSGDART
jgi:hypothetical protein